METVNEQHSREATLLIHTLQRKRRREIKKVGGGRGFERGGTEES